MSGTVEIRTQLLPTGTTLVELEGELDLWTAPALEESLTALVGKGHHDLLISLERLHFVDSTGLRAVVGAYKRAQEHDGTVGIICTNSHFRKIFYLTGLAWLVRVFDDLEQAQQSLGRQEATPGPLT